MKQTQLAVAPAPSGAGITLRPYQEEAVAALFDYFSKHDGNPLLVLPTASGKSVIQAAFLKRVFEYPGERVVLATHVKELLEQNAERLRELWPAAPVGIYSAGLKRRELDQPITVAGIQSVYKRAEEFGEVSLVIIDECFIGSTMISTPSGERRIDEIRTGDVVHHALGDGVVEAISSRPANHVYELEFSDGKKIECTGSHRIFTVDGWREAASLEVGEIALGREGVQELWKSIQSMEEGRPGNEREVLEETKILLDILLKEAGELHERSGSEKKSVRSPSGNRSQAAEERRKRDSNASGTVGNFSRSRKGLGAGGSSADRNTKRERISDLLQNRRSEQGLDDRNRGRWSESRSSRTSSPGSKEDRTSFFPRLVNISRIEQASPVPVFNLQVSGHPSYFANGKLAHNCHLLPKTGDGMYRTFLAKLREKNPKLKIIGMSATPYRMSSGYLHKGKGAIFTDIAYEAKIPELVRDGYVCPLVSKAGVTEADLAKVKVRAKEYVAGELETVMNTEALVDAAVKEILEFCATRNSWLVFCSGIKHAHHVAEKLGKHTLTACVTGKTPSDERARILQEFKKGRITAITNMNVLTTGFDAPGIDTIIMLRPTLSPGLYYQMVGRGMRLHESKQDTLVLDFAGNVMRHGPIDQVRVRPGKEKNKAPARTCPECRSVLAISIKICPDCGHIFVVKERPYKPKHDRKAGTLDIISDGKKPKPISVKVDKVRYVVHKKKNKPDSMRVIYHCGLMSYSEWVCIEHGGYAGSKAANWWRARRDNPVPKTTADAIKLSPGLRVPAGIIVDTSGKYANIIRYIWGGK